MNLRDLKENVALISLHPLTETNVSSLEIEGAQVTVAITDSVLEAQLTETKEEIEDAELEIKELKAQAEAADARASQAEEALAKIKDGESIAKAIAAQEAAEQNARQWSAEVERIAKELKELRKRKGVMAKYIQHVASIMHLIDEQKQAGNPKAIKIVEALFKP